MVAAVHQAWKNMGRQANRVKCFRCGGAHFANACKFKDVVCHTCKKKGHLAKKWRSLKGKEKSGQGETSFSRWAAPIVPILKEDQTARICSDYKVTVNQVCKLEYRLRHRWPVCNVSRRKAVYQTGYEPSLSEITAGRRLKRIFRYQYTQV